MLREAGLYIVVVVLEQLILSIIFVERVDC